MQQKILLINVQIFFFAKYGIFFSFLLLLHYATISFLFSMILYMLDIEGSFTSSLIIVIIWNYIISWW